MFPIVRLKELARYQGAAVAIPFGRGTANRCEGHRGFPVLPAISAGVSGMFDFHCLQGATGSNSVPCKRVNARDTVDASVNAGSTHLAANGALNALADE